MKLTQFRKIRVNILRINFIAAIIKCYNISCPRYNVLCNVIITVFDHVLPMESVKGFLDY